MEKGGENKDNCLVNPEGKTHLKLSARNSMPILEEKSNLFNSWVYCEVMVCQSHIKPFIKFFNLFKGNHLLKPIYLV